MGLFDGLSTPKWISPLDAQESNTEYASQLGRNFSASYLQANAQNHQDELIQQQQDREDELQSKIATKMAPIAQKLAGADTPEAAWKVVSQNPQWLVDPETAPGVTGFLKTQTQVATAEKNTVAGQLQIKDGTDFVKRLGGIDPTSRSAIQSMNKNKDGSFSPQQWQALGIAEQYSQTQKENAQSQAEIDAMSRGDTQTTVVGPKGITTTYKPATASQVGAEPQAKTLADGTTLSWMPNGKTIHVIKPNGEKKQLTPTQLLTIGKSLQTIGDPDANQFIEASKRGAMPQVSPKTNAVPANAPAPAPTKAVPSKDVQYKSPDDVRAAVAAKTITRDQAVGILKGQFGYQ